MTAPTRLVFCLPLLAALALPVTARAQAASAATPAPSAKPAPPSAGEAQALRLFKLLDTNGDGRISWAEAQVAIRLKPSLAELFRRTDTNGDGYLTEGEIRAEAARQRAERQARRLADAPPGKAAASAR